METFLGMVVEQEDRCIKINRENYVKEVIAEYLDYKKVPISPGAVFKAEDVPELPDPTK